MHSYDYICSRLQSGWKYVFGFLEQQETKLKHQEAIASVFRFISNDCSLVTYDS